MAWRVDNFHCIECDSMFEDVYQALEDVACPSCKTSSAVEKLLSMPNLGTFSMSSLDQQRATMMNRSLAHTQKEISRNPEKWGKAGFDRATKKIQSGYTGKGKK